MTPPSTTIFAAALLAGGRSSRMGCDKARLDWRGTPLWRFQLGKLMELNPERLLLSCRGEQQLGNVFAELVPDPPEPGGPLGAIARCLATTPLPLLVLAVDMPAMTVPFLRELTAAAAADGAGLVCEGPAGPEPLAALYPAAALPLLQARLERGQLRMQDAVAELAAAGLMRTRRLRAEEVPLFFNANTPEEYAWTNPAPSPSN